MRSMPPHQPETRRVFQDCWRKQAACWSKAPEGISDISVRMTKVAFGGVPKFTSTLEQDMASTLTRIKAAVER